MNGYEVVLLVNKGMFLFSFNGIFLIDLAYEHIYTLILFHRRGVRPWLLIEFWTKTPPELK